MTQLRLPSVPFLLSLAASVALLGACSSSSATSTTDGGAKDGGSKDAPTTDSPPPVEAGAPITSLPSEKWTWVPFPESKCRDGSSAGIGVNLNPASDKLMIYLEGGGACFDVETCTIDDNPYNFTVDDFNMRAASTADGFGLNQGLLDRTKSQNPVQDWSYVYVPYCTGDIHAGNTMNPVEGVSGGMPQDFAGYTNMQQYLSRIVPTFPKVSQVLFTGMSAGGFGAAADYDLAATAFGSTPVFMIDDSGPFMEDPYLAACLQSSLQTLWGLDKTVLAECGGGCGTAGTFFLDYAKHILTKYPHVTFGLADSLDDGTISEFYGFGYEDCKSFQQLSASQFSGGLLDIESKLSSFSNFGTFYFAGTDHTSTQSAIFYTRTAGGDAGSGMLMTDWVSSLLSGHATHAGP